MKSTLTLLVMVMILCSSCITAKVQYTNTHSSGDDLDQQDQKEFGQHLVKHGLCESEKSLRNLIDNDLHEQQNLIQVSFFEVMNNYRTFLHLNYLHPENPPDVLKIEFKEQTVLCLKGMGYSVDQSEYLSPEGVMSLLFRVTKQNPTDSKGP